MAVTDTGDGTSQTVGLVVVAPEHEVTWTKPEDWEVDWDDPTKGLEYFGDTTVTGYLDAGTRFIPKAASKEHWRAILSAAGNEVNVRE